VLWATTDPSARTDPGWITAATATVKAVQR
jgi:hypothetical protein